MTKHMTTNGTNGLAKKIVAVVAFFVSLAVNGLAGTTIIGGNTTAQVSDSYPNLFAPAGVTFAIWGVIYLLLIMFCVRLFITPKNQTKKTTQLLEQVTEKFILLSGLNAVWLIAWQYRVLWLSVLLIIAMLITLIKISFVLTEHKTIGWDWLTIKLPFSVYFGWITVATIANITTFLVSINWNGWGIADQTWTVLILIVGAVIGMTTAFKHHSWPYLAVFVWGYYGIWLKHTSAVGHHSKYPAVISTLQILLAIIAVAAIWLMYKWPQGSIAGQNEPKTKAPAK